MRYLTLILTLFLFFRPVLADDESHHHEDLTAAQVGTVHFPVSCTAAAQKQFEQGIALLHSFWYEQAQESFKLVAKDDPQCAMAHWGLAMSQWHQLWNHPESGVIAKGVAEVNAGKALHPKTPREQDYIAAMDAFYGGATDRDYHTRAGAYCNAMHTVYNNYPEDREGAAFYALSLLASEPENDTTFANRKAAAAVLEKLFAVEPNHPGVAHYLIHSYDKPQLAEFGLPAARRYAQIAPVAPHALHMPSHIFARLGLWQDDIDSNLASIDATRKTAAMNMGGEGHQFHAMDFLVYAYLQSGRETDAQHVIDEIRAMPAVKDTMYGSNFDPRTYALVAFPARYALELHHWAEAAALPLPPDASIGDRSVVYWARAIGSARSGDLSAARKDLEEIATVKAKLIEQKKTEFVDNIEQDRREAEAWVDHAEGKNDEATKILRTIAEKEEAQGDEPLAIPAREMLADMLVDMKRPEQALTEYQADLKFNPNRFNALYGAASTAEATGKSAQANDYYGQLVKVCAGSNSDRPELSHAKSLLAQK
jgi:tetratricopeptide (TPR) repeat protein